MARSLVIVESPAKAKTINKYLGRNYNVKASYGHVMDLPKKTIGILLPGEQNGKKKTQAQGQGQEQGCGEEAGEAGPGHRREYLRADLRSDPEQAKRSSVTCKEPRTTRKPSTWRATRTAKAKPSARTWLRF